MTPPAWWSAGALIGTLAGVLVATPVSAVEPPPGLLVSIDGITWSPGPEAGPLPPLGPLVPGGSDEWQVFVRNVSAEPADLRIVAAVVATAAYRDALMLRAAADGRVGPPIRANSGECLDLLAGPTLDAGDEATVTITATLDPGADDSLQGQTATASIAATLVEVSGASPAPVCAAPPGGTDDDAGASPSRIAGTGRPAGEASTVALAAAATAVLGAALVLVGPRRRRGAEVAERP